MPKEGLYAGRSQTMQTNAERRSELIGRAADEMIRANRVDKVPLSDLTQVKREAEQYLAECADCSILPTVRGIAARLGLSRAALYDYATTSYMYFHTRRDAVQNARMRGIRIVEYG